MGLVIRLSDGSLDDYASGANPTYALVVNMAESSQTREPSAETSQTLKPKIDDGQEPKHRIDSGRAPETKVEALSDQEGLGKDAQQPMKDHRGEQL